MNDNNEPQANVTVLDFILLSVCVVLTGLLAAFLISRLLCIDALQIALILAVVGGVFGLIGAIWDRASGPSSQINAALIKQLAKLAIPVSFFVILGLVWAFGASLPCIYPPPTLTPVDPASSITSVQTATPPPVATLTATPAATATAVPTGTPMPTPACRVPTLSLDVAATECRSTTFEQGGALFVAVPHVCGTPPATSNGFNLAWSVNQPGANAGCLVNITPGPTPDFSSIAACSSLTVQVLGAQGGEAFLIGLIDGSGHEQKKVVEVPEGGGLVSVSLTEFTGMGIDLNDVVAIVFAVEHGVTSNRASMCISDIRFAP